MLVAGPLHAEAMAAVHAAAFPSAQRWSADAIARQISDPLGIAFVAEAGGMVLARIAPPEDAEILTLAVAPAARRCGLGRALLAAAEAEVTRCGMQRMFLEVAIGNLAARRLYETAGYVEVGLRRRYYADGEDALVLRRMLQAASEPAA